MSVDNNGSNIPPYGNLHLFITIKFLILIVGIKIMIHALFYYYEEVYIFITRPIIL